jgi:hypothetical protein
MTEQRDRDSERRADAATQPHSELEVELIKDLDVNADEGDGVRGGQSYGASSPATASR